MISLPSKFYLSNKIFTFIFSKINFWVDVVIAVSKFGKYEIEKFYNIKPNKIKITYLGGRENFSPINKKEALNIIKNKYHIRTNFILDVSRLEPHKNIESLIKSYIHMRNKYDRNEALVIIGCPSLQYENTYKLAKESKYTDDIYFINFVSHEDLNLFYSAVDVFVFPSLKEGFGLPVIECMASGTPVITSNTSSLPEIAGDSALLIDPLNVENMGKIIYDVLSDDNLKAHLIVTGLKRCLGFTWKKNGRRN